MTWKIVLTGYENQGICVMCGGPLPKRRRTYCSEDCFRLYTHLFFWPQARDDAIHRAHRRCQRCGITELGFWETHDRAMQYSALEVHHIIPLDAIARTWHSLNIEPNLIVLCHDCHVLLHSPKVLAALEMRLGVSRLQPRLL